jgi:hypothetical protein
MHPYTCNATGQAGVWSTSTVRHLEEPAEGLVSRRLVRVVRQSVYRQEPRHSAGIAVVCAGNRRWLRLAREVSFARPSPVASYAHNPQLASIRIARPNSDAALPSLWFYALAGRYANDIPTDANYGVCYCPGNNMMVVADDDTAFCKAPQKDESSWCLDSSCNAVAGPRLATSGTMLREPPRAGAREPRVRRLRLVADGSWLVAGFI